MITNISLVTVYCLDQDRARDHIDRHHAHPLDLDRLAAVAGISKFHLVRCFVATYGETPIRYLTRRRIERAQDLLRATNLTVTEICYLVGFASLGSFSSRFTELVGESPSAYRARGHDEGAAIPPCVAKIHTRPVRNGEAKRAIPPVS